MRGKKWKEERKGLVMEISQSRGSNRATRYANRIALYTPSWS